MFVAEHWSVWGSAGRVTPSIPLLASLALVLLLALPGDAAARSDQAPPVRYRTLAAASPDYCLAAHDVGRISLGVSNYAVFGTGLARGSIYDCFTGALVPSCEYPTGTQKRYLWSSTLWVGAIVDGDTLVSTGADGQLPGGNEFHPASAPDGSMLHRSTINPTHPDFDVDAVSEQDFLAVFYDTCTTCVGLTNDPADDRPHQPLHLKITQKSYAWSYLETEDIVLFDYTLENIGDQFLESVYFGVFVDADVWTLDGLTALGYSDDHSGFIDTAPHPLMSEPCRPVMDINAAWTTDNDGDFDGPGPQATMPGVFAICPIVGVGDSSVVSFNWWHRDPAQVEDFGPQGRASFRLSDNGGVGVPVGDRDKYHLLSNSEIDYDQARLITISGNDSIWLPPPIEVWSLADGSDTRYSVSIGPYNLEPGATKSLALALTIGDNLHTVPFGSVYLPYDPERYFENLDFSDLIKNAITAGYIYDNPGIDTDLDGYRGEFSVCDEDTIWYRGDGVPDWRAALTPAAPQLRVEPVAGGLHLRWNGVESETTRHLLTGKLIFEGYAAYLGLDSTATSFSKVASYDVEDFCRYAWSEPNSDWQLIEARLTLEEAVCRYAPAGCDDSVWHPADFERHAPHIMPEYPDSVFYFEPIGTNAARFGLETPFVKTYQDAPRPPYVTPAQVPPDSITLYLNEDGYFKYYEYEYCLDNLLPGEQYWVSVTAFDYGSRLPHAVARESLPGDNMIAAVPLFFDSPCCVGQIGNVDCDNTNAADIADLTLLIDYMFLGGPAPCCFTEADIDQSGGVDPAPKDLTLGDVARLIDHLFIDGHPLPDCL